MQLVYLHIEEYCSLHQVEFNFSPDMHLHFDEEAGILEVSDPGFRLPERFWGENINNLSVVVGSNGAGKTSLMQYIIELYLEAYGGLSVTGRGILIFREGDMLYGYRSRNWGDVPVRIHVLSGAYRLDRWLRSDEAEYIWGGMKLIYLTNALNERDSRRSLWYPCDRYAPLYDCSMGNTFVSNSSNDVNQVFRSESLELEPYLLYEQYKQIKFVFDKRQHQVCVDLKADGYPMPIPERLYMDLMLDNHLSSAWEDTVDDLEEYDVVADFEFDREIFPELYSAQRNADMRKMRQDRYTLLRMQLNRCAIWCAVRSAAKIMANNEQIIFRTQLYEWKPNTQEHDEIFEEVWKIIESSVESGNERAVKWLKLKECYLDFFRFVTSEKLEDHFIIEDVMDDCIRFSVDTTDTEWFMEFLQKYRYICNPDYFLDFRWPLSSGENSLLSLFASLYYIYDADFSNPLNGDYQIWNKFQQSRFVRCSSVVLLIDEADLTYHPEWQRVFIGLLTAFLPKVYPTQCCQDIQIVLSTHSPILLGDVPQRNVIYLKYDSEHRYTRVDDSPHAGTFGQNIHILFKDSFFLEHGTIGLFASRKINGLLHELKRIENVLEQEGETLCSNREELRSVLEHNCRLYAELIAEPIIRRKVLMWIDELEQDLSKDGQGGRLRRLSDRELEEEFHRLREEMHRRGI